MNRNNITNKSPSQNDEAKQKLKSKQGKMDPQQPFAKIENYDTDESNNSSNEAESITNSQSTTLPGVSLIASTTHNTLLGVLKNKRCLAGVDFIGLMAKKQGKGGGKHLKGNELKRYLSWKSQMMVISKLTHAGSSLSQMDVFLTSEKIHLGTNGNYKEVSADIVAEICDILQKDCSMENVEHGVLSDYFNKRFADIRNRRNYERKLVN